MIDMYQYAIRYTPTRTGPSTLEIENGIYGIQLKNPTRLMFQTFNDCILIDPGTRTVLRLIIMQI